MKSAWICRLALCLLLAAAGRGMDNTLFGLQLAGNTMWALLVLADLNTGVPNSMPTCGRLLSC